MASEGGGVESLLVVRGPPGTGGGGGGGSGETETPLRADRAGEAGGADLVPGGGGGGGSGETDSPLRADRAGEAGGAAERLEAGGGGVGEEEDREAALEEQQAGLEGELRLEALRQKLQVWLRPYGGLLMSLQRLLVWERPLYSLTVALTLNTLFWLVSSMSLRPLFLISLSLLGLMLLERWKHKLVLISPLPDEPEPSQVQRDPAQPPGLLSVPDLSLHLADSYLTCCLFLQEALQYKRQHHGKFCIMVFSGCAVLAVVGHYVPGIMISYIMALSVLLWPLVVYHELIQRMYTGLEPILMKLDYSMKGGAAGRRHDKRIIALLREVKKELESSGDEPRAETESDSEEEELSCFAPTVDAKLTALAMAITDSELSDEEASILESGGFSVSRATTPNLSEDLDVQSVHSEPDESCLTSDLLTSDLTEFLPSVQEVPSVEHGLFHVPPRGPQGPLQASDGERPLSLLQQLASPLHFVNTHFNGHVAGGDGRLGGGATAAASLLLGAVGVQEEEEEGERLGASSSPPDDVVPQHHRSLEALSEEIVSTAISTVVQNTLTALTRSGSEDHLPLLRSGSEDQPAVETLSSLEHSLPTETTPEETDAVAGRTYMTFSTDTPPGGAEDEPEPAVVSSSLDHSLPGETTETLRSGSKDHFLPSETTETLRSGSKDPFLPSETAPSETAPSETAPGESVAGALPAEDDGGAADQRATTTSTETPGGDEPEQTALVAAATVEEEDFELLDQSELDEEGGRGLVGSVVGGTTTSSGATDTPPSPPLHQPEESS